MNSENPTQEFFARIALPEQDVSRLSFCDSNREVRVREWAESLPATRISYTGVQLYKALPELARLKTDSATRLNMLESVRPYVQQCIEGLSREFLNQPLILPEGGLKTATIAQALQRHMCNGYLVAARDIALKVKTPGSKQQKSLDLAIHRAITGLGLQLLRSYQLYTPVSVRLWGQLHTLYKLAEHFRLLDAVITDSTLSHIPGCNIRQAYLRVMMMACSGANQLRQREVSALYSGLELWTSAVNLGEPGQGYADNQFVLNLSADQPPVSKTRFNGKNGDDIRELDIRRLISTLKKQSDTNTELKGEIRIPREVSASLLDHLLEAWGHTRQRHHERRLTNSNVEVTVGLSNLHYHLARETPFKTFLQDGPADTPLSSGIMDRFASQKLSTEHDPWENAFDAGGNLFPESLIDPDNNEGGARQTAPIYTIDVFDVSPGGYCLDWRGEIPAQVNAGEVLGVREVGRRKWSVCVIRWVRQTKAATQIGIQTLGPQATPYGASMVQKTGDNTGFLRALMLPALKAVNQPATIITPILPFQEFSKVKLKARGQESTIQLTRRLFSTGAISQYTFRELESAKPDEDQSRPGPETFESVWGDK